MSLSGLKDIDREVLKHIEDRELLKICSLDKKTWNEVCDDNFLRRRLAKYPGIEKYKKENETWKEFFLNAIYYIAKMKEKFQYEYASGNFKKQYELLSENLEDVEEDEIYLSTTLLNKAAGEGELELVKYAINKGALIWFYSNGALRKAASKGYLEIVKFLVEKGANIQQNILPYAAEHGHIGVVKYLVENGVNTRDTLRNAGNLEIAKYLIEHGANLEDEEIDTLKNAAIKGRLDILKWLVEEQGTDIHIENEYPLRWASATGRLDIVKYLVKLGANINAAHGDALTAASEKGHLDIVKYLIEHGANIDASNGEALILAAEFGHLEIVKYLVEQGASKISRAYQRARDKEIVKYLKRLI